ncbi:gliding motility-associated-like protein [Sediminibacterium goheungense]|uniref:Gliding motility-associated-like protein n=1 Tax=Sediminibacterium goheungense TaxID=1086393 RepID=A0A4R6IWE4_9BACT|nr:gliding motility-associated-like protein [Sediminibacterium goheungense]
MQIAYFQNILLRKRSISIFYKHCFFVLLLLCSSSMVVQSQTAPANITYNGGLQWVTPFATRTTPLNLAPSAGTGGTPTSYSISPALPPGLNFNTTTGVISGTRSALHVATSHTITASNAFGSTTIEFAIAVDDVPNFTGIGIGSVVPAALYSVRKMNSGYNGMAMLVRRNSDNAIKHIGFTAEGHLDTTALKNFVGTSANDSGFVQVWYNQSGYGIDSAQLNPSRQPIIVGAGRVLRGGGTANRPTLVFNGSRWLTSKANVPISGLSTFSANAVAEMTTAAFYGRIISVRSSSASSDESGIGNASLLNVHASNNYLGSIRNGNYLGDGPSTFSLNTQFTAMTMFSPSGGGFTDSIVSNLRPISRVLTTTTGGSALGSNMILSIGWSNVANFPTNGGNPLNGRIAEVILLPSILPFTPSTNPRVALASNQTNYYGITVSAPAGIVYTSFKHQLGKGIPFYLQPSNSTAGAATSFSISPALPAGLTFNTATGIITGTPTVTSALTTYTVTASNAAGNFNTTFSLTVADTPDFAAIGLSGVTPTAAYSLRKLNASYNGPAIHIQVRAAGSAYNSSVLASGDIGFDANGTLDTVAMKTLVASRDAYIAFWYDQSGNNRTMQIYPGGANEYPRIMAAGVIHTLRGLPTLDFNWSGRTVLYTNETTVTNALSAHVNGVLSAEQSAVNAALLSSISSTTTGDGMILRTGLNFTGSGFLNNPGGTNINGGAFASPGSIPALNTPYIATFKRGGTTSSGYQGTGGMWIGRQAGGGHGSINGFLSELFVLPSITENQRTSLELGQSAYYFGQTITSVTTTNICSGQALSYTATATVPGTFTWSRAAVAGISNVASLNNVTATIAETLVNTTNAPIIVPYTIAFTGSETGITSTYTLEVTVNPRPSISAGTLTTCSGVAFNFTPTGSIIPVGTIYTWTNPTITVSSGSITGGSAQAVGQATISQLLTSTSSSNGTARYFITPVAASCVGTAVTLTVTVQPPVTNNTINNTTATTCNGVTPPAFTASTPIGGTGAYTFLWQSSTDGTNFVAASGTNNTATYAPGVLTQDIWYRRIVSSGTCNANTSNAFKITVSGLPLSVGTQPVGITVCNNTSTNLIVGAAGGSGSYNYQWYFNSTNSNTGGVSLGNAPTAQTASYTVPASATAGDRFYYVVITDAICGMNVSSDVATVTTLAALSVGSHPLATQTVCNNVSTTLTAAAAGATGTYSYQWFSNSTNSNTGGTSLGSGAGAQTATYTVPATATAGNRFYYVVFTDETCGVTRSSNTATVTTRAALTVGTQPTGRTICNNISTTLSTAGAGATGNYSFQWFSNTTGSNVGGTNLGSAAGAQTDTYTVPATVTVGTRFYYVEITDATCGVTVKSSAAPVITLATVGFTTQPIVSQTICNNTSIALTVGAVTGGSGNFSIRWHSNSSNSNTGGTPIAPGNGSGTVTYTVPATTTAGDRYFYAVVTDNNCSVSYSSDAATVTTRSALTVATQPASIQTICNNVGTTLTVAASGASGSYTYQWFSNSSNSNTGGTSLGSGSGAQTATYSVPATATPGDRFYYVVITDVTCGVNISSNAATITTRTPLTVGTQPLTQLSCNNVPVTITAAGAGGSLSYTYQWFSNSSLSNTGGTSISGANSASYIIPASAVESEQRYFYAVITDAICMVSVPTQAARVTTGGALTILSQPTSQTLCNNTAVGVTALVTGGSLSYTYQWFSNSTLSNTGGTVIAGANAANYTIPGTATAGDRYYYAVITENSCGQQLVTNPFTITTRPLLTVGVTPANQIICNNTTIDVQTAGAGGSGVYIYQWYNNTSLSNTGGTNLGSVQGANTNTYSIPATTVAGERYYYVEIRDAGCDQLVRTNAFKITTGQVLSVQAQPQSQVVCNNSTANISVLPSGGTGLYTYQWFSNTVNSNTGGINLGSSSGAQTSNYTVPGTTVSGDRFYYVVITDASCGATIRSNATRITTGVALSVGTQPVSQIVCNNTSVAINTTGAGASLSYTYQWYSNASNSNTGGTLITGANASSYTVPATLTAGDRFYYAVITDASCGLQVTTTVATINTRSALVVNTHPLSQTICNNVTIDLPVSVSGGSGTYTYQWYSNTVNSNSGGTSLGSLSGANSSIYTIPAIAVSGNRYYYAVITDTECGVSVTTNAATIFTRTALTVGTQPQSVQTIINNTTTNITVAGGGATGAYNYQWYQSLSRTNTGGSIIGGATGATFTVPATAIAGSRYFYAVITDAGCGTNISSDVAEVITTGTLTISSQPLSQTVCNNTSTTLSVLAAGGSTSFIYQWYSNIINSTTGATLINGATNQNYTVPASNLVNDRYFYVVITDANLGNTITSDIAKITTRSGTPVIVNTQPAAVSAICLNGTVSLQVGAIGGASGTFVYQWYSNNVASNTGGTLIPGQTGTSFSTSLNSLDTRFYYATVADPTCGTGVPSNVATVNVRALPSVSVVPLQQTVCLNAGALTADATVAGGAGSVSYQWYSNTTNSTVGGTSLGTDNGARTLSFTPSASSLGTMYYYVEANFSGNGCGVVKSNTHQVTVNYVALPSDIVITTPNLNLCKGLSTSLKASLSATSTIQDPVFNWYADANFTILLGTGTDFVTPVLNNTTTYYVKVSGSNACENLPGNGQSQTIAVTEQAPEVILPANLTVCAGVNTSQIAFSSTVSGTTYTWTNNNTSIGLAASGNGNIPSFLTVNSNLTNRVAGISVTPFANGCVGVTKTFTITVVPNALVNDTSFIVCSAAPLNYTPVNVPSGKKYSWVVSSVPPTITGASDNLIPVSSFSQTLSSTSATPVNVVYAVTPDGCSDRTFTVTITVNPVPQINNQSLTSAICNGAGFTTSNFAGIVPEGTLYTWTIPTSNPLGAVTGGNGQSIKQSVVNENNLFHSRSDIANAIYLITPFSSAVLGGCVGQSFTLTVPVNPKPVLVTTSAGSICNRTAAVYTPSSLTAGVSYTWRRLVQPNISNEAASGVNGFSEVLHNTAAFPVLVDYEYTLTANGCSNTQIVQVLVNPDPLLSSPTSLNVCSGALLNYTPSSLTTGTSFTWSRAVVAGIRNLSNAGTSDIFEALVNTSNDPVEVTYRFTLTANGCTHNEEVRVTVNPIPAIADITQQAVCSGTPVQVNFTGSQVAGTVYNWTNGNSNIGLASSGTGNILFTTANTSNQLQTASISVVPVANGCSGSAKNFNILVQSPLTLSSSTTPSAICTNTAFVYTPESNAPNVSFSWSRAFVNGISNGAATGNGIIREILVNNSTVPVKVTYEMTLTANGCNSTQLISVTVNPIPAVSNITDKVVCNGSSVEINFTGSPVAGTAYNWTNTNSNIGLASSGTGNILFTATNISTRVLTGSLSVTPVANGCSGPAKSFAIQVQPTLVLTSSTAPLPICTNTEFIYVPESNAENVSFSWSRALVNGISNGAATGTGTIRETLINDSNVPVKVSYEITITANGCTSIQLISVTVNPMPTMNDIAENTVCNGAAVEISFNGSPVAGTLYNWTNSNSNIGLPSSGTGNILFTATNLSTQLLTGSLSVVPVVNGCSGAAKTFNIKVQPTLSLSSSATPPAICSNTVFSYQPQSVTTGVSFSWSRAIVNGISNTVASGTGKIEETLINNTNTAIQVPYEITITSTNGCSAKKMIVVTVNPTPSVANVSNRILCNNSVAVINFSGSSVNNTNYRWTNDNTDLGILSEGLNDIFFVATNTTNKPIVSNLVVTPEAGFCKGSPITFTITINPSLKLKTATSLPAVCSNQLLTYEPLVEGNSNAVISWTRPSVFGISNRAASGTGLISERLVNTTSLPVLVTYVITIASEGCSSTENVSVLINPAINITNAGSGFSICSKEAFLFSPVLSVSGAQLTWAREAVPGISNAAGTGVGDIAEVLVNTTSVPVDVLYKYTISQSSACVADQFVKVTVQPQPQLISSKVLEVCSNVSVGYSPESNLTGTNFTWNRPAITGIANSASGGIGIIGESLVNRTNQSIVVTYQINMNNINACSNTDSIKVTVKPSPTVNIMSDQLVCKDARTQVIQFTGVQPNTIFNWTNTETGIGLAASGTGNIPSFIATNRGSLPLSATIDVVPELNGCKGASASVLRFTVNPGISSQFIESAPLAACPNELVGPLIASYPNGGDGVNYAFQWMVSTDRLNYTPITTSGANNRRFFAQAQTKDTWYKMMVSSGGCTAYTDSVKVRMGVAPVVTVSNKDNYTISIGNATQLVAEGATSYIWTPRSYISDAFISNPLVSPLTDNFRYVVTGINSDGCTDTASVIIKVTEGYSITPNNILTPNNDGYNDLWVIKNIQHYSTHRISIYNANGSLIKTPWVNNYVSWDGKNDAGVTVPAGTYYYVIDLGSGKALIKGSLTIIY